MEKYEVNGKEVKLTPKEFEGKKSVEAYEKSVYEALKKIGVINRYISIEYFNDKDAKVVWKINDKEFSFTSTTQKTKQQNIGALSQALQEDVRQILRGIKTIELVMKQYSSDRETPKQKPTLLQYDTKSSSNYQSEEKPEFPMKFYSQKQAKETIEYIKKRYSNFTDPKYLPDEAKKSLREAYLYLGTVVNF